MDEHQGDAPPEDLRLIIKHATELIHKQRLREARTVLIQAVKEHPRSEQSWLLLSQVVPETDVKVHCLEQVLSINPVNKSAWEKLNQILTGGEEVNLVGGGKDDAEQFNELEPEFDSESNLATKILSPIDKPTLPIEKHGVLQTRQEPEVVEDNSVQNVAKVSHEIIPPDEYQPPPVTTDHIDVPPKPGAWPQFTPDETPTQPKPPPPPKRRRFSCSAVLIILALFLLAGLVGAVVIYLGSTRVAQANILSTAAAVHSTVEHFPTLPPTWTSQPTPTIAPTSIATATRIASPTPTLQSLGPTVSANMDRIQEQVADLRGLEIVNSVPRYLVTRSQLASYVAAGLLTNDYRAQLEDQKIVLSALGLIKANYDMVNYALNGIVDNIGGVYVPWEKTVYVIGLHFSGIERYIYSHEFDHALVDQHYQLDQIGVYPDCNHDAQRCQAIRALVEGDATLLMNQWWLQYAGPQDYQDILTYNPPRQAIPDEFPPPFVLEDADFPYVEGHNFVQYLYDQGNWAAVNQVYTALPLSTEQILHPSKYLNSEAPILVIAPPIEEALGKEWQIISTDVLGEWWTYLLLAFSADNAAQIDVDTASEAAAGWGGDVYQVFYNEGKDQSILALHWVWDTPADFNQFNSAFSTYMENRFRGASYDHPFGDCWEVNGQLSCSFVANNESLWILAPDQDLLDTVLNAYPDFP